MFLARSSIGLTTGRVGSRLLFDIVNDVMFSREEVSLGLDVLGAISSFFLERSLFMV